MTYVHTILANYPPPREDGVPFTSARIDEATSQGGPWNTVQTFPLSPVDTDPRVPQPRNFTVTTSALEVAWLKVIWIDGVGNIAVNDPIFTQAEPTTLASVADVRRLLKLAPGQTVSDDDLAYALSVAVSYLESKLPDYSATGGTEVYYNVRQNDPLFLPVPGSSVTAIRAYTVPNGTAQVFIAGTDYDVTQTSIKLWGTGWLYDPRYSAGDVGNTVWAKVEVDWVNSAPIPVAVREGVAMTAASFYETNSALIKGMRSERIGSYSYTLSDKDVEAAMPPRARQLLRDFMKRKHVFVT